MDQRRIKLELEVVSAGVGGDWTVMELAVGLERRLTPTEGRFPSPPRQGFVSAAARIRLGSDGKLFAVVVV